MKKKEVASKIDAWLKQPIYWDGIEIFEQHSTSKFLIDYLKAGSEDFRKTMLHKELLKIKETLSSQIEQEEVETPAKIKAGKQEARALMDRRFALRERARLLYESGITEGEELHNIAKTIMQEINPRIDEIEGIESFWGANKFLPESQEVAISNIADLIKRRNNLRSYVSRGTADPAKLEAWKSELFELENKINAIQNNS